MKAFFFHYNKPASAKAGKPQITLHVGKQCLLIDNIVCNVPTSGKIRKHQPRFVVSGRASSIVIADNIAIVS
jgi:hypothetical protein